MLHGGLIEILFEVAELEQKRDRRCVANEMNRVNITGDPCVSLKLARRPALPQLNYTGITTSQKDVPNFCDACH